MCGGQVNLRSGRYGVSEGAFCGVIYDMSRREMCCQCAHALRLYSFAYEVEASRLLRELQTLQSHEALRFPRNLLVH